MSSDRYLAGRKPGEVWWSVYDQDGGPIEEARANVLRLSEHHAKLLAEQMNKREKNNDD